jgi:hypothetical protein
MRIVDLGGAAVLAADGPGEVVTPSNLPEAMAAAFAGGARTLAIAVDCLDPAFFELRTGVAGEIVQKLVNYRLRLAVVGGLPEAAVASRAFAAFVREGNRGDGPWFVATLEGLGSRLAEVPPRTLR